MKVVTMSMEDASVGDNYVARFKDFGKLGGLALSSSQGALTSHASLANLRGAGTSGYYVQPGGDLYLKAVATGKSQSFTLSWSTNAEFNTPGGFEGWTGFVNITGQAVANGVLTGTASNNGAPPRRNGRPTWAGIGAPILRNRCPTCSGIGAPHGPEHAQNTGVQLFFATSTQPGFSATRVASAVYSGNGAYQTVTLELAGLTDWNGTITDLRLDPVSGLGIQFDIDWIRGPGL